VSEILVAINVTRGQGKHIWAVPVENMSGLGLRGNVVGTLSIFAAVWSKTSFALTLIRFMKGRWHILLWAIIVTMNVFMSLNALFMWIRCSPVPKGWNPYMPGTCWNPQVYPIYGMFAAGELSLETLTLSYERTSDITITAGYSAAMDFVLALLPWQIIWGLQMKKKEKLGVALAMSMGIL
jgi:hypothetical protein